jgi:general secretion pathway protein G
MKNKKGFTLVELLVVIAIIAILAAVVAPNAFKAIEKSKVTAIEADYRTIKTATLMFFSDTGIWPANLTDDEGFVEDTDPATTGWNGPYVDVWTGESPIGTGYEFVNGTATDPAPAGEELITANVGAGNEASVYLRILDLTQSAYDVLLADLGSTLVIQDAADATWPKNVYLKIADK